MAQDQGVVSKKPRTIEIDEDLRFQKREWLFQRIGIAILFAFVVSAFLGFTGMGGPMSRAESWARAARAIQVRDPRTAWRHQRRAD
jgi:hypothetical protein